MSEKPKPEWKIRLRINGEKIPLNSFVQGAFSGAIAGLVSALKGLPDGPSSITVEMERRKKGDPVDEEAPEQG